jgi:hypothetical protein
MPFSIGPVAEAIKPKIKRKVLRCLLLFTKKALTKMNIFRICLYTHDLKVPYRPINDDDDAVINDVTAAVTLLLLLVIGNLKCKGGTTCTGMTFIPSCINILQFV